MHELIPARPAPAKSSGVRHWLRHNLFAGPFNSVLTVVAAVALGWAVYNLLTFVFVEASWGLVWKNMKLFGVYRYPVELLWRPLAGLAVMLGLMGVMAGAGGLRSIVGGAFAALWGFCLVVTVLAVVFWPSVRYLWPMVVVLGAVGYLVGARWPRASVRQLPLTLRRSMPRSRAILRIVGEAGGVKCSAVLSTVGRATSSSASGAGSGAGAGAAARRAAGLAAGAAGAGAALPPLAPARVRMTAPGVSLSPTFTLMAVTLPPAVAGIEATALPVSSSIRLWPSATSSPTFTSRLTTTPESAPSPRFGNFMSITD